ncbi:MAG: hypothetical protein QW057_00365 [Candidatus Bathyarchaeia archaeon]
MEREWATLQLNKDGTSRLSYNVSVVVTGDPQQGIYLGMPNEHISDASAVDSAGNRLTVEVEKDNKRLKIFFHQDVYAGQSVGVWASATIDRFIFKDETNPGNVGVQFIPAWWDFSDRMNLRVLILLPPGVQQSEVKTGTILWNNVFTVDDRLGVYWERPSWPANEKFTVGVSFPERYVDRYEGQGLSLGSLAAILIPLGLVSAGVAVIAVSAVMLRRRREPYVPPRLSMEVVTTPAHQAKFGRNASVRDDLDPVEASILIPLHPGRIVAMILYSMARKKALRVVEATPRIRVELLDRPPTLRYYERYMVRAVASDGFLDEEGLRTVLGALRRNVDDKMAYYSRLETRHFYLAKVEERWREVQAAGIPQAQFDKYNENLLWLMIDPKFKEKTKETVKGPIQLPREDYDFYYYRWLPPIIILQERPRVGIPTPGPTPVPGPTPMPTPPQQRPPSSQVPVITDIEKLADSFVTSVETMTSNAVKDVEKAMQAITTRAESSTQSHTTSGNKDGASCHCVCACVSCACVCACVSCACACASGGGFCFRLKSGMKAAAIKLSEELGFTLDFYPKSLIFPLAAPPRYGFKLTSQRGGSINLWSQANSTSYSVETEGLTPEEHELMTRALRSLKEAIA